MNFCVKSRTSVRYIISYHLQNRQRHKLHRSDDVNVHKQHTRKHLFKAAGASSTCTSLLRIYDNYNVVHHIETCFVRLLSAVNSCVRHYSRFHVRERSDGG
jgi:hypothetical protein